MCRNALNRLQWIITPPGADCMVEYDQGHRPVGVATSLCEGRNYSVVLDAASDSYYNSTLNVILNEDVTVTCVDTFGPQITSLRVASKCIWE